MRIIAAVLVMLGMLASGRNAQAWTPPLEFNLAREVRLPALQQDELVTLKLDALIYEALGGDLSSLQLVRGNEQIPFLLREARSSKEQIETRNWSVTSPMLKPLPGNGLEITIALRKEDPQPRSLRLVTPLNNFEQRVQVLASDDGREWTTIASDVLIFDYAKYMDVRRDTIPLPAGEQRHFRIVVEDVTAEQESQLLELTKTLQGTNEEERIERVFVDRRPFRIERIEFAYDEKSTIESKPLLTNYAVRDWTLASADDPHQTMVVIAMRGEPLTEFTLLTQEKNFSRQVSVLVEKTFGRSDSWKTIASASLSRIDFKNVQQENLTIRFPEMRKKAYRLVIENQDSPALRVTGIEAKGNVYELVFLAGDRPEDQAPDASYVLLGGEQYRPLKHDTKTIQSLLNQKLDPLEATLGDSIRASDFPSPPPHEIGWTDLLNNKPVLFSVIGLLVLALGWGLFKAAKRVDALPKE